MAIFLSQKTPTGLFIAERGVYSFMVKTFLIGTVDNRIGSLLNMLISARRYIGPWEFIIVAQHYTDEQKQFVLGRCAKLFGESAAHIHFDFIPDYMGCFGSKMYGMKWHDSDIWLSMDDDMLILPETDFDGMAEVYMDSRYLGMLAGIHCSSVDKVPTARQKIKARLKNEPILGTTGGLMFGRELRDLFIKERDGRDILFDDLEWSLLSYTHGYENAIYFGSLIVHMIGSAGGFRNFFKNSPHELPDPELINIQYRQNNLDNANAVVFMGSKSLKPKAHALHNHNKRMRAR